MSIEPLESVPASEQCRRQGKVGMRVPAHLWQEPPTSLARILLPLLVLGLGLCSGCAVPNGVPDRSSVSGQLQERMEHAIGPAPCPFQITIPPGVCLEDGLSEDEAITVALWNNAAFQEVLVDLGLTRADLIQARLLPNPELWYLSPLGVKQLEYALEFPIDVLWLRPFRIASARFENARTAERLAQSGLDLIRDVRQSFADALLAQERVRVAEENARLRGRIASLAEVRLRAGDASPLETATARIDALQAQQDVVRVRYDITLTQERLRNLLGTGALRGDLPLDRSLPLPRENLDADTLANEAVSSRPDALSADEAVEAARERLRLSRLAWFRFAGILDANGRGIKGFETGPGFRVTIPIFNWGQGGIARAEAELEQAVRRRVSVHNQIILDVYRAFAMHQQARAELNLLETKVRPEVESAIRRAEKAFKEGGTSYLLVLESTRQLLDSLLREAQLHAELRRAWADLERGVGRRLTSPIAPHAEVKEPSP